MAKRFREKIAVVVLTLLLILISVCSCAYMKTSGTWTVAAAHVDDTVGSMTGYTVIVYGGTVDSDSKAIEDAVGKPSLPSDLYISDVRADYLSKSASVVSLDVSNLGRYVEPTLFLSNGKRIVVFSAEEELTEARFNVLRELVFAMEADIVLCVAPVLDNLPSTGGVDVVLLTSKDGEHTTLGSSEEGTYILRTPERGSVGVILITPSNIVSSKVVDEL